MNKKDLNNKCIKYSSDITEEIFNKIIRKAESLGFIAYGIDRDYEGFKKHRYLRFSSPLSNIYQTVVFIDKDDSLITVDYILEEKSKEWYEHLKKGDYIVCIKEGYNEDIIKDYIFRFIEWQNGKENKWIIGEWLNNNTVSGPSVDNFRLATPEEIEMYKHAGKPVDVTTYKLPKEPTIPEYVKCVSIRDNKEYTVGNIYKTEKGCVRTDNGYLPITSLCSNLKNYYDCYDFEPSTKEEFEKQQVVIKTVEIKSEFIHVNNLEINKVYKCSYKNDGNYIFWKYLGKDSAKSEKYYWIKTTPYLKPDEKYLTPNGGFSNKQYTDYIKEVTFEESAWYEKCLQEERYISFEEFKNMKEEFKLPEKWCIVKNKKEICDWFNKSEGRTSTFNLDSRNDCYIHFPPVNKANVHDNIQDGYTEITFEQFKKYVLKEYTEENTKDLSKYIGRYIKALVDYPQSGSVRKGEIGLIVSKDTADFPSQKGYSCSVALHYPDKYELIPEDYKPESSKEEKTSLNGFSIGDWCYVTDKESSDLENGKVYKINQINPANYYQKHHFDNGSGKKNNSCWLSINGFRRATGEEILKFSNSKKYFEYKIGDKVIINKKPSRWSSALCSKDIRDKVSYPFIAEIQNLKDDDSYIAAKIRDGGWDLTTLVQENCIEKYIEPPIKDTFEVGKWYIYKDSSMLGCYSGGGSGYGLKKNLTKWSDTLSMTDNNWKSATTEQVEDALLKYAKNTYPIGCIVNSLGGLKNEKVNSIEKGGSSIRFITYNNNRGFLFNSTNGKWAEIVSTPEVKKDSMQEILEEAKKRFPIGCKYYPVHENGGHSSILYTQTEECYIYNDWIIGSCNVRNPQGVWAKLYEEPIKTGKGILDAIEKSKKPKFEYKFKIGDKVLAVKSGMGISLDDIKNYSDRVYTITELGKYAGKPGYKVSPAVGNTLSGGYNGFIDERTFELYIDEESIPVEWINTAQEIYKSKGVNNLVFYINYETSETIYKLLPGSGSKEKAKLFISEYCSIEPIKKYPLTPEESLESSIKLKKFEIKKL